MLGGDRLYRANQIANKLFWKYNSDYVRDGHDGYPPNAFNRFRGGFRKVRKPCSGFCCGNPRKWLGEVTTQEKRADITTKEFLSEL